MFQTFEEFLTASKAQIPILHFTINLLLSALLAFILGHIYVKYGTSLSNRRLFARHFLLMTMTTMMIITIVKSSLALSLGLVGALSIVRFRAAIKEPEELAYLFLAISIGLGFGADQGVVTLITFILITGIIVLHKKLSPSSQDNHNLYLSITGSNAKKVELNSVMELLKSYCLSVTLKRFQESNELFEALFLVDFDDYRQLNKTKKAIQNLDETIKVTYLDNKGIY